MDESRSQELLQRLGCKRVRKVGKEIMATCPFSENHWRGDRKPSFSAKLSGEDRSPYFCFSCHEKGTLEGLAIRTDNEDLVPDWKPRKVRNADWMYVPKNNVSVFGRQHGVDRNPVFFDDRLLEPFVGRVSRYVMDRGITIPTAKEWQLGVDRKGQRAIFTLRDMEGRLAVVNGRDVSGYSKIKYTNYVLDKENHCLCPFIDHEREEDFQGPTKSFFLYGEYQSKKALDGVFKRRSNDLIVVEGQMDTLAVWQQGWNVVGIMGSYPSEEQIEKLVALVPKGGRLVSVMDGDKAGRKCAKELGAMLNGRIPLFVVDLPDDTDPADVKESELEVLIDRPRIFNLTGSQ